MRFTFSSYRHLKPAGPLLKAILVVVVADILLLTFILLRRAYRKRYFAIRDARIFAIREQWDAITSGKIAYRTWLTRPSDLRLVEGMVLDAFEIANPQESAHLLKFMRTSGLIEKLIYDARHLQGWRRQAALVSLGRTRAAESVPALAEALRDRDSEAKLAALRGLGRMASPQAAMEILNWIDEVGLVVPSLPVQSALLQTCAECPRLLLRHLQNADPTVREVLGRVLGEVATSSMTPDLLVFVDDQSPELRAAAARGLAYSKDTTTVEILAELAKDAVWFVRLRAVVSLGALGQPAAVPSLLTGLRDSNRLVRLRAAEGLLNCSSGQEQIFNAVVALKDQYGLHAYLAALENAGLQAGLETEIKSNKQADVAQVENLLRILRTTKLSVETPAVTKDKSFAATSSS
jgi:HEAT repeat protein